MTEKKSLNQAEEVVKNYIENLSASQKIGIILSSLPAELMMEASSVFTEKEIKVLMPQMSKSSMEPTIDTYAVIDEFLKHNNLWEILGVKLHDPHEILTAFTRWANKNPKRLGKLLKATWKV